MSTDSLFHRDLYASRPEVGAVLHALEVAPAMRRQGVAHNILRAAGAWAQDHGAETLVLLVTEANAAARALYASLKMDVVGQYHYRMK